MVNVTCALFSTLILFIYSRTTIEKLFTCYVIKRKQSKILLSNLSSELDRYIIECDKFYKRST